MIICLVSDPFPTIPEPSFVKEAYVGVSFEAHAFREAIKQFPQFPHGFFEVQRTEFLEKMKAHNTQAFAWLSKRWDPSGTMAQYVTDGAQGIRVIFPAEYCTVVGTH